jgi:23S rRNA (guanosine2251-2'-O)-methyltransferase
VSGPRRRGRGRSGGAGGGASIVEGRREVAEAIRAGLAAEVLVADSARATPGLRAVLDAAGRAGVPVRDVAPAELEGVSPAAGGVIARLRAEPAPEVSERGMSTWPFAEDALVVVLDGVTDPQNLGAVARSAEAAGVAMLVSRLRRAAPISAAAIGASSGALLHVPHARVANVARAIERLQRVGFFVAGLQDGAELSVYDRPCPEGRIALVVGGEERGMSRLTRERCDLLLSLPMRGRVGSLNASAALAAALYAWVLPSRA